jgi:peptidoglycan-N-acetylglucosamine deacetylase
LKLVQCWDDGVTTDARLVEILRRHGAKASFNLNAGLYGPQRTPGWLHQGTEVWRLGWAEMKDVYRGFTIANHSLTHPALDEMPLEAAQRDIAQGRDRLQQFFGQPVEGFVYPFGRFNPAVVEAVRETGHHYGRTTALAEPGDPAGDPMRLPPSCHFLAPDFWARFEQARTRGAFHLWGHSYEMTTEAMWADFESQLVRLAAEPGAHWCEVTELLR